MISKNKIIKIFAISVSLLILTFFAVNIVSAQTNQGYTPLAPLPGLSPNAPVNLPTYVDVAIKIIIGIAGVLAVIMIMIGGVQYMSTDAISGKQEGKDKITKAVFGLVLAIASWLILNTISPNILNLNLDIKETEKISKTKTIIVGVYATEDKCKADTASWITIFKNKNCSVTNSICTKTSTGQWGLYISYKDEPSCQI